MPPIRAHSSDEELLAKVDARKDRAMVVVRRAELAPMTCQVTVIQSIRARFAVAAGRWRERLPFAAELPARVGVAPSLLVRHSLEIAAGDRLALTETLESQNCERLIAVECVELYQGPSYTTDSGAVIRHRCSGAEQPLDDATFVRVLCERPHRKSGELLVVNLWRSVALDDATIPTRLFSASRPTRGLR